MATNDELTRDMVLNVLKNPDVFKIKHFQMDLVHFHPISFASLAILVEFGKIRVKFAALSGTAAYLTGGNIFEFGFTTASSLSQKALVLHEAAHAVLDVMIAPGMKVADSEAIAYIVQCQFARANNTVAGHRLFDHNRRKDRVFKRAWAIAGKILANKRPTSDDYDRLKKAISKHPAYENTHNNNVNWDGVS